MRFAISLLAGLLAGPLTQAGEPEAKAKASALLALCNLQEGVAANPVCPCKSCDCLYETGEFCQCRSVPFACGFCEGSAPCKALKAMCLAALDNKPVVFWIGMEIDPKVEKALPGAVHVKVKELHGHSTPWVSVPGASQSYWFNGKSLDVKGMQHVLDHAGKGQVVILPDLVRLRFQVGHLDLALHEGVVVLADEDVGVQGDGSAVDRAVPLGAVGAFEFQAHRGFLEKSARCQFNRVDTSPWFLPPSRCPAG